MKKEDQSTKLIDRVYYLVMVVVFLIEMGVLLCISAFLLWAFS